MSGAFAGEPGCIFSAGGTDFLGFNHAGLIVADPRFLGVGEQVFKKDHRNVATPPKAMAFAGLDEQCPSGTESPVVCSILSWVLIDLRNSFRSNVGWFLRDRKQGFAPAAAEKALGDLASDIDAGFWGMAVVDWPQVWALAERLSRRHTTNGLHRGMDLLHVATASYLKVETFLTFDENQAELARKAGMQTPLQGW